MGIAKALVMAHSKANIKVLGKRLFHIVSIYMLMIACSGMALVLA